MNEWDLISGWNGMDYSKNTVDFAAFVLVALEGVPQPLGVYRSAWRIIPGDHRSTLMDIAGLVNV